MISIIKSNIECKRLQANSEYSLYVNDTLKIDFEHYRQPEDLAQLLRDAADAIDLSNNIIPPHLVPQVIKKPKLSMMERMTGIKQHLDAEKSFSEKQDLDY